MEEKIRNKMHSVILENRKKLSITGITDVDNFDEKSVLLYTEMGEMLIQGKNLHVNDISVETGDMTVEGDIQAIVYGDKDKKSPLSFLGKIFR